MDRFGSFLHHFNDKSVLCTNNIAGGGDGSAEDVGMPGGAAEDSSSLTRPRDCKCDGDRKKRRKIILCTMLLKSQY